MSPLFPEALTVALEVIGVLEELGVRYQLGGSLASSVHGLPRQTNDVDLVVDLVPAQVPALAERLGGDYYFDADRLRDAIRRRASCNLLHLATGVKVDLFVKGAGAYDEEELSRSVRLSVGGRSVVAVKSAEDTILRKLLWYRLGREVSERQWSDVENVLRVRRDDLDLSYLRRWAEELEIADLLERLLDAS